MENWRETLEEYIEDLMPIVRLAEGSRSSGFWDPLDYLQGLGIDFLLIGGLAASHFGPPRLTYDLDVLLRSESEVQELKRRTVRQYRWPRNHAFLYGDREVEVLSPEYLNLPDEVVTYVFDTAVTQSSGYQTPSAEGIVLLKCFRLSLIDQQDIAGVLKQQAQHFDFNTVVELAPVTAQEFLRTTWQSLLKVREDH